MPDHEIPKAYDPKQHEDAIYAAWEHSGFFNPDNLPGERTEPFTIVLPPPNVTGTLHMGHAAMLAIEDIMIRFARMRGKKTLWLPGTDHAAIATQTKVENILFKEEGTTRHDLGREVFLKRVEKFAQDSHDTIVGQCRKMGASLDWSREAYTLDAARNHAVNVAFKKMYDDGLIYRGHRVVNWDPIGQTTISDIEIVYNEESAKFYYFRYGPFVIGTARPETKFGDKYVVVHPDDDRYRDYVHGQKIDLEWINGPIIATVIKDAAIDMAFGTGVMTITPWHSMVDFDIAERHGLDKEQIIDREGMLLPIAGEFAGMSITEAREKIVEKLSQKGLLVKEEEYVHQVARAERSGALVEPQIMKQWFIDVNKEFERGGKNATLKSLTQDAVRSGSIEIIPERFEKSYFEWVDHLRDWCISRQLWFGHRIPAWYRGEEVFVGEASPGEGWMQDSDTLDTWFSAGIWTCSTLGWPEQTKDLKTYHPTSVLETGYDILTFWVVRMVTMTTYLLGEVPFKKVYLHGLVRDEKGRKMSKSLDNIINPLDMIASYGADATRLSLGIGSTPGNDTKLSEEKIAGYRNFTNKLWNIARFVFVSLRGAEGDPSLSLWTGSAITREIAVGAELVRKDRTLADRWILARLHEVTQRVTMHLESHEFSAAGELLRDFTWSDFADWYLETAKLQKTQSNDQTTDAFLLHVLETLLKLWHPFMPFVTEVIWGEIQKLRDRGKSEVRGMLMIESWPVIDGTEEIGGATTPRSAEVMEAFAMVQEIITTIRNLRSEYDVAPAKRVTVTIISEKHAAFIDEQAGLIRHLARVESLRVSNNAAAPANSASAVLGDTTIFLSLEGLVDTEKEKARLTKELAETQGYVAQLTEKLANEEFRGKAPEQVIASMQKKLEEATQKIAGLEQQLQSL